MNHRLTHRISFLISFQAPGGAPPPRGNDAGVPLMQKIARQYSNKGQKSYNYLQSNSNESIVFETKPFFLSFVQINWDVRLFVQISIIIMDLFLVNFRVLCRSLPEWINSIDSVVVQSILNTVVMNSWVMKSQQFSPWKRIPWLFLFLLFSREFYYQSRPGFGAGQVNSRHGQYSPSNNRAVAIVVPIIGTLVVVGALIIVFLYYKKLRNEQQKSNKPSVAPRTHENYSGRTTIDDHNNEHFFFFFSCSTRRNERKFDSKSEHLNVKLIEFENHLLFVLTCV